MNKIAPAYFRDLLALLDHPKTVMDEQIWGKVEKPFSIQPEEFLKWASVDLTSELGHRHTNALSNTKRALDAQVECLLIALGLNRVARKQRWGFPRKLKAIQTLQIVAPEILNRINRKRNILEHEFERPTEEAVIDALDTVSIFVAYTNAILNRFLFYGTAYIDDETYFPAEDGVSFGFDQEKGTLTVNSSVDGERLDVILTPQDDEFLPLLGRLIKIDLAGRP